MDVLPEQLERAKAGIAKSVEKLASKGVIDEGQKKAALSITTVTALESVPEADLVIEADLKSDSSERLREALIELDDRSRDVIQRRWLADQKTTLQGLADEYGVSAERIRQIEKNAMKKLKLALAG